MYEVYNKFEQFSILAMILMTKLFKNEDWEFLDCVSVLLWGRYETNLKLDLLKYINDIISRMKKRQRNRRRRRKRLSMEVSARESIRCFWNLTYNHWSLITLNSILPIAHYIMLYKISINGKLLECQIDKPGSTSLHTQHLNVYIYYIEEEPLLLDIENDYAYAPYQLGRATYVPAQEKALEEDKLYFIPSMYAGKEIVSWRYFLFVFVMVWTKSCASEVKCVLTI